MLVKTLRWPMYKFGLMMLLAALALSGCSSTSSPESASAPAGTSSYSSAQEIVDALDGGGIDVSKLQSSEPSYIREVGGESWDLEIDRRDADINIFPDPEALATWVEMSKSFGGVAVTGDIWAVNLESDADRQASLELAPQVAEALGGTVQK
jgi:uncharacterized protein YceK